MSIPNIVTINDTFEQWRTKTNDIIGELINSSSDKKDATVDPTIIDDTSRGYSITSLWINTTTNHTWICVDATIGSAVWVDLSSTSISLSSLTDTTITSNTSGEILKWNGTNWINATLAETGISATNHNHAFNSLTGITITSNTSGEILKWNGSTWINNTLEEAGIALTGHNHTLDGLSNITITSNTSGEILKWNGTNWINATLAETGIEPANVNLTKKNVAETISSRWNFNGGLSGSTSPFLVDSTVVVANLNADLLDGNDASAFAVSGHNHTLDGLSNITITSNTSGEILKWNGTNWINATLAETGIEPANVNLTKKNVAETISSRWNFNGGLSGSTSPFLVDSTYVVTNLNADLLDGNDASAFALTGHDHVTLYEPLNSNLTALNVNENITSRWTFSGGTSGVDSPFLVDSTYVVTNLNADLLDGNDASAFALNVSPALTGVPTAPTATVGTNSNQLATTAFVLANAPVSFPAGTKMVFHQTSAPTGWTKDTIHNDKAFRVVSGVVGSSGTVPFSSAFASKGVSGTVGNTTLTTAQMPAHTHTVGGEVGSDGSKVAIGYNSGGDGFNDFYKNTGSAGGNGSHTHGFTGAAINLAVQYVDLIIASKS